MQIELTTILNKAWMGLTVLIPWAKKTLDNRFEATEKKVGDMTNQLTDLSNKIGIIDTKLEYQGEELKKQDEKIDEIRNLLIKFMREEK